MTALTAGVGLVPLVVDGLKPGREIFYPVATVILGGLVTSTFCEFLIHPGLFWRFSGQDASRLAAMMEPITPSLEPQSNNQNRHDQLARLSPLADQERAGRLFNP